MVSNRNAPGEHALGFIEDLAEVGDMFEDVDIDYKSKASLSQGMASPTPTR